MTNDEWNAIRMNTISINASDLDSTMLTNISVGFGWRNSPTVIERRTLTSRILAYFGVFVGPQ